MATLSECHIFECEECCEKSLIVDSPRNGDRIICPHCETIAKVTSIVSDHRRDNSPMILEAILPRDLI